MSPEVMAEYIHDFDVDLALSPVVQDESTGDVLGLGMLGVRGENTWVTRLGVSPVSRRRGAGAALLDSLLEASHRIGAKKVFLEVIKDNTPAQALFAKMASLKSMNTLSWGERQYAPYSALKGKSHGSIEMMHSSLYALIHIL